MDLSTFALRTKTTPAQFRLKLQEHGLEVSHQAVMLWFKGQRRPAPKHMEAIEAASGGKVTRHHQRPDVYGPPPRQAKKRAA